MKTLIALCGMPGSGKSTITKYALEKWGIATYYAGQILVDACLEKGIEPNYNNKMEIGVELGLFTHDDPLRFLKSGYEHMRKIHHIRELVIFDSLRSYQELKYLQIYEDISLVGVCLDRDERYRRLRNRDNMTDDQIQKRDLLEIGHSQDYSKSFNVGTLLSIADYYIITPRDDPPANSYFKRLDFIFEWALSSD